jgi:hypothetical protein
LYGQTLPGLPISAENPFFDLIDRPFDYAEPGVERIMGFQSLSHGQIETALLHFPLRGDMPFRCTIHPLPMEEPEFWSLQQTKCCRNDSTKN